MSCWHDSWERLDVKAEDQGKWRVRTLKEAYVHHSAVDEGGLMIINKAVALRIDDDCEEPRELWNHDCSNMSPTKKEIH